MKRWMDQWNVTDETVEEESELDVSGEDKEKLKVKTCKQDLELCKQNLKLLLNT